MLEWCQLKLAANVCNQLFQLITVYMIGIDKQNYHVALFAIFRVYL